MSIGQDASARANSSTPSISDCQEISLLLQNQLWIVQVCNRFYPVAIAGNQKAFPKIRIREGEQDAVTLHWLKDLTTKPVKIFQFKKVLFGLAHLHFC